jgi:hypothetical protein
LVLQEEIFKHIPLETLSQRPGLNAALQTSAPSLSPLAFSYAFYGIDCTESRPSSHVLNPLVAVLEHTFYMSQALSQSLSTRLRPALSQVLRVLSNIVHAVDKTFDTTLNLSWKPSEWLHSMLDCLDLEVCHVMLSGFKPRRLFIFRPTISPW